MEAEFFHVDRQTDRHTAELLVAFCNFMNKPKNEAKAKRVFGSQREPALFPHFDVLDIATYLPLKS
jgi:hypothetical protein